MAVRSALINVMTGAALRATRGLVRDFGEIQQLQVSAKGPDKFSRAALARAESILRVELSKARPEFGFARADDPPGKGEGEPRWLGGPLDGAANFAHGIPHFALSIAAISGAEITAGVIYDPLRDEMFRAEKGGGGYLNDGRLRVSARRRLEGAMLAASAAAPEGLESASLRRLGSTSLDLAYVAAGRLEGCCCAAPNRWEVAAGSLLVRECGGLVSTLGGNVIVAANGHLHDSLVAALGRPDG